MTTIESLEERVKVRISEVEPDVLADLTQAAVDKITLRIGEDEVPAQLASTTVELICAMHNRLNFEGLKREDVDNTFRVELTDSLMEPYEDEIYYYIRNREKYDEEVRRKRGKVYFI